MKKLIKIGLACIAMIVVIGLIAGKEGAGIDQTTPEKAVESYLRAIEDSDVDDVIRLTNSEGREWTELQKNNLEKAIIQQKAHMFMSGLIIGNIIKQEMTLDDGRVQVAFSVTDSNGSTSFEHIAVKKVGDKWYVNY